MGYAAKRRLAVFGILFLIFGIFAYWFYDAKIKEHPSCSDKIQNQEEEGVDCGGPCQKICSFKAAKVNIKWTRAFEVVDGVFNIASEIENPNYSYAYDLDYKLKFINSRGIKVGEIKQHTHLNPLEKKIIFYPGIKLKGQKIDKVFLIQDRIYNLKNIPEQDDKLTVNAKELNYENNLTRLKVIIQNDDFKPQRNIQVSGVLMDATGTVIDINRTYIDYLDKYEKKEVYMTWPRKIDGVTEIKIFLEKTEI